MTVAGTHDIKPTSDLKKAPGKDQMREAKKRVLRRNLGKAYVQLWTGINEVDSYYPSSKCEGPNSIIMNSIKKHYAYFLLLIPNLSQK